MMVASSTIAGCCRWAMDGDVDNDGDLLPGSAPPAAGWWWSSSELRRRRGDDDDDDNALPFLLVVDVVVASFSSILLGDGWSGDVMLCVVGGK
jgi:hypothetical protein